MEHSKYTRDDFGRAPLMFYYEITQACDLVCDHCRAEAQTEPQAGELDTLQAKALLDQIEKQEVYPQLGTAIKLSRALDSAFGRLISGVGDRLYSITRREAQRIVSRSTGKAGTQKLYTYKSLAPEVKGRHMEALLVTLEENPQGELSVHDGEEFIYVLEGRVTMQIGEDKFELAPGDSLYYLSTTPHLIAAKEGQAQILAVLYDQ